MSRHAPAPRFLCDGRVWRIARPAANYYYGTDSQCIASAVALAAVAPCAADAPPTAVAKSTARGATLGAGASAGQLGCVRQLRRRRRRRCRRRRLRRCRASTWTAPTPPFRRRRQRRPARYGRAAGSRREGNRSSPQSAEVARHFNLRVAGLRTRGVGPAPACSGRRRGGWRGSDQRRKRRGWPLRRPPRRTDRVTDSQSWAFGECFLT